MASRSKRKKRHLSTQGDPLVSCILPTYNRRQLFPQAVKYFQRQTYPNKELIIVDDGADPVDDLIPDDPNIRNIRLSEKHSLGAKLNIGIEAAHGRIIQKLDDDDYYHPEFLNATVTALLSQSSKDAIVGFDCFLVLLADTLEVKHSGHGWHAGGTLCFYKQLWEKVPFRDEGNDSGFWKDHHASPRIKIYKPELFIVLRHGFGHTWAKTVGGDMDITEYLRAKPTYSKPLKELVSGEDLAFYQGLAYSEAYEQART